MTARQHILNAMNYLAKLSAGGSASASEESLFLIYLNEMLASWQAEKIGGATSVVAIAANVTTVTITSTAIATFALITTDNTYPTGYDAAIDANLALWISGSLGIPKPPDWLVALAATTKKAISPAGAANAAGA